MSMKFKAKLGYYSIHFILVAIILFPLLFAFASSLRPLEDIFRYVSPITWQTFIPTEVTFEAYKSLFVNNDFGRVLLNTFFVAITTVIFSVLFNSMAAFAFAKFRFRGSNILFVIIVFSFMIPFEIIAIPLYSLIHSLGFIDTYFSLILPGIANGLVIFLFRQFFLDLPDSIFESARMDGASWGVIYWKVAMPLCKSVTASAALLTFLFQWESYLWPLIAIQTEELRVVQVAISFFTTEYSVEWNGLFAASVIAIAVPAILVLFLQRAFVEGIASTGSKD